MYADGRQERLLMQGGAPQWLEAMHMMSYDQGERHSTWEFAERVASERANARLPFLTPPITAPLGRTDGPPSSPLPFPSLVRADGRSPLPSRGRDRDRDRDADAHADADADAGANADADAYADTDTNRKVTGYEKNRSHYSSL